MSFVFTPIPSLFGPEDALALGQAAAVTSGHRPSGLPMVPSGLPLRRRRCVDVSLTPEIWQGSCNIVQHRATSCNCVPICLELARCAMVCILIWSVAFRRKEEESPSSRQWTLSCNLAESDGMGLPVHKPWCLHSLH
jgi:hypothetical protein